MHIHHLLSNFTKIIMHKHSQSDYNTGGYYQTKNTNFHTRTHQYEHLHSQKEAETFRKKR